MNKFEDIRYFLRAEHVKSFDVIADVVNGVVEVTESAHNTTKAPTNITSVHAHIAHCKPEIIREEDKDFEQDKEKQGKLKKVAGADAADDKGCHVCKYLLQSVI